MGGKKKKTTIGYKYFMGLHMGLCRGPVDVIRQIRVGDKVAWTGKASSNGSIYIDQPNLFGGEEQEGGIQGTLDVLLGAKNQPRHEGLATMLGGLVSAFRGVTTTFFDGLVCAMSPYPKEWSYLVQKTKSGWYGDQCWYPEKCEIWMSGQRISYDDLWAYKVEEPGSSADYSATVIDDSSWPRGKGAFGNSDTPTSGLNINTFVPPGIGRSIWLRRSVSMSSPITVDVYHDDGAWLWANGQPIALAGISTFHSRATLPAGQYVLAMKVTDGVPSGTPNIFAGMEVSSDGLLEIVGMNPAHILRRLYTDPSVGRGLDPDARLDETSWRSAADTFFTDGMGLCMKWSRTSSIAEFAAEVINHAGAAVYTSRRTGKIVLKPIRGDYELEDLPLFTPDTGLLGVDDDQSMAQSGGVNEIVVKWMNPLDKSEAAVREKNLGSIMAAGGKAVVEEVNYPGIPTDALARRIARRDLQAKSGFIKRLSVRLDRRGKDIMPGHVFRISDEGRGIQNMVLRAGRVEFGSITDGTITVTALQDVFGLPETVFRDAEENAYVPPSAVPRTPSYQGVMEAPYRELSQVMSTADLAALDASAGFLHAMAVRPSSTAESFLLMSRVAPASYAAVVDTGAWCPGGQLSEPVGPLDTQVILKDVVDLREVILGTAALLGSEIVRVDAVDLSTSTLTIARGCADTVPQPHTANTEMLCYDSWGADSAIEYTAGVTVNALLLTRTAGAILDQSVALPQSVEFASRQIRPYPPANVKINRESYPQVIKGSLALTWSSRNRLAQADNLLGAQEPSVAAEPGTTYTVEVYDQTTNVLVGRVEAIAGTEVALEEIIVPVKGRVEVYSVRDGWASWQRFVHTFMSEDVSPRNPRAYVLE